MKYEGPHVRIRNLGKYQAYKDRNPPWVKLYNEILDDLDFGKTPDATKWHALGILLLASRTDNHVPAVEAWVKQRINATASIDLALLVEIGWLENCDCDECVGTSQQLPTKRTKKGKAPSSNVRDVWEAHLEARSRYYELKNGTPPASLPDLTPELVELITAAIKRHGIEKTRAAGIGIFLSDFHVGQNDKGREYLNPDLCWRIKRGQQQSNNVERFAELALEAAK